MIVFPVKWADCKDNFWSVEIKIIIDHSALVPLGSYIIKWNAYCLVSNCLFLACTYIAIATLILSYACNTFLC